MIISPRTSKPDLGTPIDWSQPICDGLVGFWPFNEGAGASAFDGTPNARTITWGEPSVSWGTGPAGTAATFLDGVNFGQTGVMFASGNQGFSVAARIYTSQSSATTAGLISLGATSNSGQPYYLLRQNGTAILALVVDVAYQTLIATVTPNRWYTIVSTFTGSPTLTEAHYVDGQLVYSGARTFGGVAVNIKLFVGSGIANVGKGGCDWVGVWGGRALSDGEARAIGTGDGIWDLIYGPDQAAWLLHAAASSKAAAYQLMRRRRAG